MGYPMSMKTDSHWRERLLNAIDSFIAANPKISERQIGIRAGVGQSWVSDFKNGKKPPKLETFIKICDYLGVSTAYVLTGINLTPESLAIAERLLRLPPEAQDRFAALADLFPPTDQPLQLPPPVDQD